MGGSVCCNCDTEQEVIHKHDGDEICFWRGIEGVEVSVLPDWRGERCDEVCDAMWTGQTMTTGLQCD